MLYTYIHQNLINTIEYSLNWTIKEFIVSAGDSILWNWDINHNVSVNLELEIFETISQDSNVPVKNGFRSLSGANSFFVTFSVKGIYYFKSRDNITGNSTFGKIAVTKPESTCQPIEVYVGGVKSLYSEYIDNSDEEDMIPLVANELEFFYNPSFTPMVFSVTPNLGISNTEFKISGTNFSRNNNIVKLGNYSCVPLNQTEDEIVCELPQDTTSQPRPHIPLLVSVRNADPGYGFAYIENRTASTVIFYPLIASLDPSEGSLAGGTDVLISGTALHFLQAGMSIQFGAGKCIVQSVRYSTIQCRTEADFDYSQYDRIQFIVDGKEQDYTCLDDNECVFSFSQNATAEIYAFSFLQDSTAEAYEVNPAINDGRGSHFLNLTGEKLSSTVEDYNITLNNKICVVILANSTDVICEVPPLPAGQYTLGLSIKCNEAENNAGCYGNVRIEENAQNLSVEAIVTSLSPSQGSVFGETAVTLSGYGLSGSLEDISVSIGNRDCEVISATHEEVVCITTPCTEGGLYDVTITDRLFPGSLVLTDGILYEYSFQRTPNVTGISPSTGSSGEVVVITGVGLMTNITNNVSVTVGGMPCVVQGSVNSSTLECRLGLNFAGRHPVKMLVPGLGSSNTNVLFKQEMVVTSISNTSGSLAGGNILKIEGSGFDPSNLSITICGLECSQISFPPTLSALECVVPSVKFYTNLTDLTCNMTLQSLGVTVTYSENYSYLQSLTAKVSSINDTQGGTEGGTSLLIGGNNFTGNVSVTIGSSPCIVTSMSAEEITCITGQSGRTMSFPVRVWVPGKGFADSEVKFQYVDIWSSNFTWGGLPPREGNVVYIPRGHTLILDTVTPVLAGLFIQGGELIFDREKTDYEVELHIEKGLITNDGRLEVGSEEKPFTSKTQIVIYGHYLSPEIPSYGAKTLALRHGTIEMHGRPLNVTWTRLRLTAHTGDFDIYLEDYVDWEAGGTIVLASTSFNPNENEERVIKNVTQDAYGSVIKLTRQLAYRHISMQQKIAGWIIETRAEVAYISRNVVVRGNKDENWYNKVTDCPEKFNPSQFSVKTCLEGRFRSKLLGDQFGCQIMIQGAEQSKDHVQAKLEYVEISHAGQAFSLGRYPINFHHYGNMNGSFIKGCSVHHTFNRAIGITGVDAVLVENNVAYNTLGHAYFFEEGNEQYNTLERNLGVYVQSSSSLLNTDLTPAAFWLVSPYNTVIGNTASGGTHLGFWYCILSFSKGVDSNVNTLRPNRHSLFQSNSAHSFRWYGLWIYKDYYPPVASNNKFENFIAWKNKKGVDFTNVGSLQLYGSVLLDNRLAGIEISKVVELNDSESQWHDYQGLVISDSLIVGQSEIDTEGLCTESGLVTPKSYYLTVSSVTFANFFISTCVPITACFQCRDNQGGFETRYRNITIVNTDDKITWWQWPHEHIHRDLDGTLTGFNTSKIVVPRNNLLVDSSCSSHSPSTRVNGTQGYICPEEVKFGRLAIIKVPPVMNGSSLNVSNEQGHVTTLPYLDDLLYPQGRKGWMMNLQLNHTYTVDFDVSDFSYRVFVNGFSERDYVIWKHMYQKAPDMVKINGISASSDASFFSNLSLKKTGDYYQDDDSNTLSYIIKGGGYRGNNFLFETSRCSDCFSNTPSSTPSELPYPTQLSSSIIDSPSLNSTTQLSFPSFASSYPLFSQTIFTTNLQAAATIQPSPSLNVLNMTSISSSSHAPQPSLSTSDLRSSNLTSQLYLSTSNVFLASSPPQLSHSTSSLDLQVITAINPSPSMNTLLTITSTSSLSQFRQSTLFSNLQYSTTIQPSPSLNLIETTPTSPPPHSPQPSSSTQSTLSSDLQPTLVMTSTILSPN